jgi:glutamate carboxypeptidase
VKKKRSGLESRIKLLHELVDINSGTANISGVNRVQRRLERELVRLGFKTSLVNNSKGIGSSGQLLVGQLAGSTRRFVTFVTHADTVFEPESDFQKMTFYDGGERARGPGVIDDKGGIVVALSGISEFLADGENHPSLRFVCAPSEETGSEGFLKLFASFSKDSMMVLGFEPALDNGSIVHGRWGNRWYEIGVTGKEAHAGRAHELGANAGHELVIKLDKLQRLTNYQKRATVNIGSITAGAGKFNVVCGHAEGRIDSRFPDEKTRTWLDRQIKKILSHTYVRSHVGKIPTRTKYRIMNDCPPLEASSAALPFVQCYLKSVRKLEGRKIGSEISRGAADINGMRRKNLIGIDGLGAWGGRMHSTQEFINIHSLSTRATALKELLDLVRTRFC